MIFDPAFVKCYDDFDGVLSALFTHVFTHQHILSHAG
jgi:hypothetical protein